jgi:hypothetical protein
VINQFARENRADTVFKLASLPRELIDSILVKRGIDRDSLSEVKEVMANVDIPLTPEEALAYSFRKPFRKARFGDGSYGIYYSALEDGTCVEEIRHHYQLEFEQFPHPRYFHLLTCDFAGLALVLIGHEGRYPNLISSSDAGYPFCQELAGEARRGGVDALYTRSAREPTGTCVPVFTEKTLSNPLAVSRYRFFEQDGKAECEKL